MQSQDKLRIALLAAFAIGLHDLENIIPTPIPWLRFGFANIITLTALILYGLRTAMMITLIRVLIGSLLIGSFLGPGFVLSLSGGVTSTLIMGGILYIIPGIFSPLGLSIIGAFFHNITQLGLAYILFIRKIDAILYISPLILLLGIITGVINGILCIILLIKIKTVSENYT